VLKEFWRQKFIDNGAGKGREKKWIDVIKYNINIEDNSNRNYTLDIATFAI